MRAPKSHSHPAAAGILAAAETLVPLLLDGRKVCRRMMNRAMVDAFGGGSGQGIWTQRDSFIATEIGLILFLREMKLSIVPADTIKMLDELAGLLPTQTVRSEEQIALHHFSTPLALSWLVGRMASIAADDVVLEPSAGTGMLAAWAGKGCALHLNEIDETRAEILRLLFPYASVTCEDGAKVSQVGIQPTVIVMNPPFARNAAGGEDKLAAARHIAAAVTALRPGGRLVAIMPDSFSSHGRAGEVFARALQGCRIAAHFRVEGAFKSHGTSVPVRLLAIDKASGQLNTPVVQRTSLAELLPFIEQMPARLPFSLATTRAARSDSLRTTVRGPLFKALAVRSRPAPVKQPSIDNGAGQTWAEAAYSLIEAPDDATDGAGVYAAWRPQRIVFANAADHPAALVESAAMASVTPPAPNYAPRLPRPVIENQILSAAQLETVVYALDALGHDLPGRYVMPDKGLDPVPNAEGHIYRQGFFLGDGTGAGKGRQLAGILMDQWLRGNRRQGSSCEFTVVNDFAAAGCVPVIRRTNYISSMSELQAPDLALGCLRPTSRRCE